MKKLALLLMATGTSIACAQDTIFFEQGPFEAALSSYLHDSFDDFTSETLDGSQTEVSRSGAGNSYLMSAQSGLRSGPGFVFARRNDGQPADIVLRPSSPTHAFAYFVQPSAGRVSVSAGVTTANGTTQLADEGFHGVITESPIISVTIRSFVFREDIQTTVLNDVWVGTNAVPEPTTIAALMGGLAVLLRRRRPRS